MEKYHKILSKIKYYRIICFFVIVITLVLGFVFRGFVKNGAQKYRDQLVYKEWDESGQTAQISVFVKESADVNADFILNFEKRLEQSLTSEGIEPQNENARLYTDCFSTKCEITLASDRKSTTVSCLAVGGDFFRFHPVELVNGTYFTEDDLSKDTIILDEETAWLLFGGNDVTGKEVYLKDRALLVRGVYHREQDEVSIHARGDYPEIYIPYELTDYYMETPNLTTYEICLPNPVKGFAFAMVNNNFVIDGNDAEFVENSDRFGYENLWNVFKDRKFRMMQNNDILLPYWEKVARFEEDELAPKTVVMFAMFITAFITFTGWGLYELMKLTALKKKEPDN